MQRIPKKLSVHGFLKNRIVRPTRQEVILFASECCRLGMGLLRRGAGNGRRSGRYPRLAMTEGAKGWVVKATTQNEKPVKLS